MKKNCTIFPQPLNVLTLDAKGKKEGLPLLKPYDGDFPGSPVVKNLPATAGYMSLIPGQGRSHMSWSNPCTTTTEPSLYSLRVAITEPKCSNY